MKIAPLSEIFVHFIHGRKLRWRIFTLAPLMLPMTLRPEQSFDRRAWAAIAAVFRHGGAGYPAKCACFGGILAKRRLNF